MAKENKLNWIEFFHYDIDLIIKEIENYFDSSKDVVEEIESIMGASIKELLMNGVRNEGVKYDVICPAMPLISEKILGGKGKTKEKVYWLTEHFLVEYEEDKRYSMQNEIRRLTDEVYLFKLQRVKEKMQDISLSDFDMKKFRMLTPKDLNSLLSQIYSAEINYIEYNRQEVGEKNIVI